LECGGVVMQEAGGGHDLFSCSAESFQFIVLTSSVFEHIALN
jgi:hypothetical protein